MRESKYLKEALDIESETYNIAQTCYHHFKQCGDNEMAEVMRLIFEDESKHIEEIKSLIKH